MTERHRVLSVVGASVVEVDPPHPGGRTPLRPSPGNGPALRGSPVLATEFALDLRPPEITDEVIDYAAPSFTPVARWSRCCGI